MFQNWDGEFIFSYKLENYRMFVMTKATYRAENFRMDKL